MTSVNLLILEIVNAYLVSQSSDCPIVRKLLKNLL